MPRRQDDDDVSWPPADRRSAPHDRWDAGERHDGARDDDARALRSGRVRSAPAARSGTGTRALPVAVGFALAAGATLAVFLTDDPRFLRIAVIAVAWAFVIATFAAGRRGADRAAAASREAELRRSYEVELEREVAARREYELGLENELRRETEETMLAELDALRRDLASLTALRDEVAEVSDLRGDLAPLVDLRLELARVAALREDVGRIAALGEDVARLAALRDDVAALTALRSELGQLGELRADMGRLRAELTEQLSSEMLVERIVMRTQASRTTGEQGRPDGGRPPQGTAGWSDDSPPRELTGGWPAIRLDEPRETSTFERVRIDRPASPPPPVDATWNGAPREPASWESSRGAGSWEAASWEGQPPRAPSTSAVPASPPAPAPSPPTPWPAAPATTALPVSVPGVPPSVPEDPAPWRPEPASYEQPRASYAPPTTEQGAADRPERSRPSPRPRPQAQAAEPEREQSPIEWLAARSLLDDRPSVPPLPELPSRRPPAPPVPPAAGRRSVPPPAPAETPGTDPGGQSRLAEILAENGVTPATGGRRRRRYRDEDGSDDVLSRVLGQG